MKFIVDTHLLLWAAAASPRLPMEAHSIMNNDDNELFFSAASIWEVAIKQNLGRKDFKVDARLLRRGLLDNGYSELPIDSEHAVTLDTLPDLHKDPFDRILVAQAISEGITLLTADTAVAKYPGPIHSV